MSPQQLFIKSNKVSARGFSLIEVMVSICILTIGLLSVAALVTNTMKSGTSARYVNMANILASEKLDSLNKWPSTDPNVAAGGSLTGPSTCAAGDAYCDQVTMTEASGADYETQTQLINLVPVTTTIVQTNAGCVDTPTNCSVPAPAGGGSTFTRRWLITAPVTVTSSGGTVTTVGSAAVGPRRVTVIVTLTNQDPQVPVSFQMSMVRP
jgi:type IV pilus modification protein PilV